MAKLKKDECCQYSMTKMLMGLMLFLAGYSVYAGYATWDVAVMAIGALVFLKGLIMQFK